MRLPTFIAAASALAPAAAAAHPSPHAMPAQAVAEGDRNDPALVREADGSFTVRRALPAYPDRLEPISLSFRAGATDRATPTPLGRRRSVAEEATDEDLERAFEEAMDMARFGMPD